MTSFCFKGPAPPASDILGELNIRGTSQILCHGRGRESREYSEIWEELSEYNLRF